MSQFKFELIKSTPDNSINWVFLPGGPGLGSKTMLSLIQELDVSGKCWLADYPYNSEINDHYDYNNWSAELIKLVISLENVVIVAHSFGGMFILSIPHLEQELTGLVLLNTAPSFAWLQEVPKYAKLYQLPDTSELQNAYMKNPTDALFKKLTIACAPFFFTQKSMRQGIKLLESLPYNHRPYDWAAKYFHPTFHYQWVPQNIPTLIIGGEHDPLTPLHLFQNDPAFQRNNISIHLIKDAGHFAWLDDIKSFKKLFADFQKKFDASVMIKKVTFKNPDSSQFQLIYNWFIQSHVQEWFDHPETGLSMIHLKKFLAGEEALFTPWLAYYEDKPFAYLMTSTVTKEQDGKDIYGRWREKQGETYTLDLFIGNKAFLGKGLASLLIQKFIRTEFPEASAFLIDPEIRNIHAIHVYEKAGFVKVEEFAPQKGQFVNVKHVLMKYKIFN